MKNLLSGFFTIIFILVLLTSSQAQDLSKEKIQKLEKIGVLLERAMLNADYETILEYHCDDVVIMPGFDPAIKGIDALKEAYEKNEKVGLKYHSFSGTAEKRWMCGNQIYEYGTFGMSVSSKENSHPKAYYGSYFQIWQEYENGALKVKYLIWNLDFNPFVHE